MTKEKMIYESPDGGKTVYERPFGSNPTERVLVDTDSEKEGKHIELNVTDETSVKEKLG